VDLQGIPAARDGGASFAGLVTAALPQSLEDQRQCRLISLKLDRPDAWNRLYDSDQAGRRACTLELAKTDFASLLDYRWELGGDGTVQGAPITVKINALRAYLKPRGPAPGYTSDVRLNQQTSTVRLALPSFALDPATMLSAGRISGHETADGTVTIDALADLADWDDLYLVVDYTPVVT
jgi:hypothetical protein